MRQPSPLKTRTRISLPLSVPTIFASLAGSLAALRLFSPSGWTAQFLAPFWKSVVAFIAISFASAPLP